MAVAIRDNTRTSAQSFSAHLLSAASLAGRTASLAPFGNCRLRVAHYLLNAGETINGK